MGYTRFDNVICSSCGINSNNNKEFQCYKCGECLWYQRPHCHEKVSGDCIGSMKDCLEHYDKCDCDMHEECICQNP